MAEHKKPMELYAKEMNPCPLPFCTSRDDQAPIFSAQGYVNKQIKDFNLEDFRGKWVILFFYASDFTFV